MNKKFAEKLLQKTTEDYNKIAEEFSITRSIIWPELEGFIKYIKKGNHILDLGCGNGRLYDLFKDLSIDYTGIDKSQKLIKVAKEKWKNTDAEFRVGDILEFSETKKYDAVFLIAVFHHIPNKELRLKVLKKIYSVLEPGGMLFMTNWMFWQKKYLPYIIKYTILKLVPAKAGTHKMDFYDILIPWKSCGLKTYGHSERMANRYYHAFTKREIKKLAKRAGFDIIKNKKSKWNYVTVCKK
ncbi:MAG: class I SAM-dependent methyltransferase [Patescibacteria group bacterium]|nr:class I SAM-dependent methyltransferase [Patescibacteria group bacterium]